MDPGALLIGGSLLLIAGAAINHCIFFFPLHEENKRLKAQLEDARKNDRRDPKSGRYVAS